MTADVLHAGHIVSIQKAKQHCDYLVVALNCNPDNKNPVQSIYERWVQLQANKNVDDIIPYNGRGDLELVAESYPYHIRFLGEEYKGKDWDGKEQEKKQEKQIIFLPRKHNMSSTNLKERIINHNKEG